MLRETQDSSIKAGWPARHFLTLCGISVMHYLVLFAKCTFIYPLRTSHTSTNCFLDQTESWTGWSLVYKFPPSITINFRFYITKVLLWKLDLDDYCDINFEEINGVAGAGMNRRIINLTNLVKSQLKMMQIYNLVMVHWKFQKRITRLIDSGTIRS